MSSRSVTITRPGTVGSSISVDSSRHIYHRPQIVQQQHPISFPHSIVSALLPYLKIMDDYYLFVCIIICSHASWRHASSSLVLWSCMFVRKKARTSTSSSVVISCCKVGTSVKWMVGIPPSCTNRSFVVTPHFGGINASHPPCAIYMGGQGLRRVLVVFFA